MSQGRRTNGDANGDTPPRHQNGIANYGTNYDGSPYVPSPPFPSPTRGHNNGTHRGRGHPRHTTHPDSHYHPNGKPGHTSLPAQSRFAPVGTNDIDNLQARIRNMLSDNDSPTQQTTQPNRPPRGRGSRGGGGLYHSPPLHRTQPPPQHSGHRNTRSYGRETPWDNCEDITAYALGIVKSLEIPDDERREKEEFCEDLQQLVQRLRPSAKVELFGSFANTFTIANSDIDCCVTDPSSTSDEIQSSGLPQQLQKELDSQGFETNLLTFTRIPILKVFRPPSNLLDSPNDNGKVFKYPLHCDVGWQNRLALHNTALLRAYSKLDSRVREIVLFVKYWTKCRVISRPRYGTLCSYGYVLMILYYLTHVASPAVLPNLQGLPMRGGMRLEDVECEGCNIYFSKDGSGWKTQNTESVGELIKGFFNFFAFEWHFKNNVISIRSPTGMLTKESKGWTALAESTGSQSQTIKSRYLLAIEDPFELSHNVARTVNHQGRLDIRGEFIRAAKMLNAVHGRKQWLSDVCIERVLPDPPPRRPANGEAHANGEEEEKPLISDEVVETGGGGAAGPESPGREDRRGYARVGGGRSREEPSFVARTGVATVEQIVRREPIARDEEPYFVAQTGIITLDFLGRRNDVSTDNVSPVNGEREDIWG